MKILFYDTKSYDKDVPVTRRKLPKTCSRQVSDFASTLAPPSQFPVALWSLLSITVTGSCWSCTGFPVRPYGSLLYKNILF